LERVLLEGRPRLRMIGRLAGILEDEIDSAHARDGFWRSARRKLGKLRRLTPRDIWQIEILRAKHVAKPMPAQATERAQNPVVTTR
jgi:hypothetical protein